MASISKRLSLHILLATMLVFVAALFVILFYSDKVIANEATMSAEHTRDAVALHIEKELGLVEEAVKDFQAAIAFYGRDPEVMTRFFSSVVTEFDYIISSSVLFVPDKRPAGTPFCALAWSDTTGTVNTVVYDEPRSYDFLAEPYYLTPVASGRSFWTEPHEMPLSEGRLVSTFSCPIFGPDGEVIAIVTADVNLDWLQSVIERNEFRPYDHSITVLASKGLIMLANNDPESKDVMGVDHVPVGRASFISEDKDWGRIKIRGEYWFFVYGTLENEWSAVILTPYSDAFASVMKMRIVVLLVGLIALLLIFFSTWHAIVRALSPLKNFTTATKQIAQGHFNTELPVIHNKDEVGALRDSFDFMQKSLTGYISDLKATTAAKEKLESELSIASRIQLSLLPQTNPSRDGLEISSILVPAREVGGDLYDYNLQDDRLFFSVGDVSGKGIPAALLMSSTQSASRFNRDIGITLDNATSRINNYLSVHNQEEMFVTMFFGLLDVGTGHLDFCNAGHNPLLVCPPGGEPYFLKTESNFVLGLIHGFEYKAQSADFAPGTAIVAYTDGVTEAENSAKELFGEARLVEWARGIASIDKPAESLLETIRSFTGGNEQNDDITILVIKF